MDNSQSGIVAVAHVGVGSKDRIRLRNFYRDVVGLKLVIDVDPVVSIFEVGTTHFFIQSGELSKPTFDFASRDLLAFRARLLAAGVACKPIERDRISGHEAFSFLDPDRNKVSVCDAHLPLPAI